MEERLCVFILKVRKGEKTESNEKRTKMCGNSNEEALIKNGDEGCDVLVKFVIHG